MIRIIREILGFCLVFPILLVFFLYDLVKQSLIKRRRLNRVISKDDDDI